MSEYMFFMQQFDRSYTSGHRSMGTQSHTPRKHCPSLHAEMIPAGTNRALRREVGVATLCFYTTVIHRLSLLKK